MEEIILKTTDLTKKYDNKTVVDELNLEIKKGEIFGLLGPNVPRYELKTAFII